MFSAYSQIFGPEFVRIKIDARDSITPVSKYTQNTIRNYLGKPAWFFSFSELDLNASLMHSRMLLQTPGVHGVTIAYSIEARILACISAS